MDQADLPTNPPSGVPPAEIAYAKMYGGREAVVEVLRQAPQANLLDEEMLGAIADMVMED